ncbi:hypothetical protein LSPH26S_02460 [Lysinibacillus sphaericus]|nr:hypothetical protein LSP03_11660 [Lysinibacillus sphaericus]
MSGHSYFSLYILYFKYLPLNQSDVKRSDIQSHVPLVNSIALTLILIYHNRLQINKVSYLRSINYKEKRN